MSIQDPTATMMNGIVQEITGQVPPGVEPELEVTEDLARGGAVVETLSFGATLAGADPSMLAPDAGPISDGQVAEREMEAAIPGTTIPIPTPKIPIPVRRRLSSGRYRSAGAGFQLELRVDVDGAHPTMRVSGDFFQAIGLTVNYFGSFMVNAVTVTTTLTTKTIEGLGVYTFPAGAPKVRVTIPRVPIFWPAPSATVQFFTTAGAPGATYVCRYQSPYMRTVLHDQDITSDAIGPAFTTYNTGSLPSGGPARVLSVQKAYAEAGVEMLTGGVPDTVPIGEAGADAKWSNSELHASMLKHFEIYKNQPQWTLWQLVAKDHEYGAGLYGIMFDSGQRFGSAVFTTGIGGTTADQERLQLYTYVHEMGHSFNLMHSWQKSLATPPKVNNPSALSWMNYPWYYPGGAAAFWSAFPFQFDGSELVHIRHGFRNNVIQGGNPFTIGASLFEPMGFADPVEDNSGLRFEIEMKPTYIFGEPVVAELKLYGNDMRGKQVHTHLDPATGLVQIAIKNPAGEVKLYEPIIEECVGEQTTILDAQNPSIYKSAYIGYGKDGFYFDQPGAYTVRAIYYALDGSQVMSNTMTLRVRHPHSAQDEEAAELLLGDQQGTLLALLGSDASQLQAGNDALETLLVDYPKHPLTTYARLAKGVNFERTFKTVEPVAVNNEKKLNVRKPKPADSVGLLSDVVSTTQKGAGVDNITLNMTMRYIARAQKKEGNKKAANETLDRMVSTFRNKHLKPHVMARIESEAAQERAA